MSRGFVKEDDLEHAGTDLPERPISLHPNYVTPLGLQQLEQFYRQFEAERLLYINRKDDPTAQQKLAKIDRELRYFSARLESAQLVPAIIEPQDTVLFGTKVIVEDEYGETHTFVIVGEDEADINQHKVNYLSPIAKALIGKKLGDTVIWQRPAGNISLEIIKISH